MSSHRRALVTGASTGIGHAFARRLAQAGYRVTAVARSEHRLRDLVGELGPDHHFLIADLTTEQGLRRVVDHLADQPVDLLVNNAGTAYHGPFTRTLPGDAATTIRLNCEAMTVLAHAFLTHAEPGGALINVSSTLAFAPTPDLAVYSASKAFAAALSVALWHEHKDRGIYVMGLCPGPTATESAAESHTGVPKALIQTPEELVAHAMKALTRRKRPIVVPGSANTLFALVARVLPHSAFAGPNSKGPALTPSANR
ncbi:SDR family oxidoreductase [Nocardia sp. XZ_19_385]|uniref:SDR family NAD(P)-dependent oxidoreductase n=1 Tax=Nocardia sp. XZ_19_385 TaxID=2769488 RepID=UPI001890558B|nr:SDR family NAD(P)-dependent oxidoreductase [Nocardia sp. XZ_19_385]